MRWKRYLKKNVILKFMIKAIENVNQSIQFDKTGGLSIELY